MKTLLVLRHGHAVQSDYATDHERSLTKQGVRESRRIGRLLRGMPPEVVVCSTATRADETAHHALASAHLTPSVQKSSELYESDVSRHLQAIHDLHTSLNASSDRLLIVGHNPTLEGLVSQLVSQRVTMKTGALAVVVLEVQQWGEVDATTRGVLVGLFDPEMMRKKLRVGSLS